MCWPVLQLEAAVRVNGSLPRREDWHEGGRLGGAGVRRVYLLECEAEGCSVTGHRHCLLPDEAFPPQ